MLLTNGWDHAARRAAADQFQLDYAEIEERHHLTFDTYEEGKLSLDAYLAQIVFYEPRDFSVDQFKAFMQTQSQPYTDMIDADQSRQAALWAESRVGQQRRARVDVLPHSKRST